MSRQLRDRDGHAVGCPSENGCDCGYQAELLATIARLATDGSRVAARNMELLSTNRRLAAEVAEWKQSFELYHGAIRRGTALWREATGRDDVLPDVAELVAWLLTRLEKQDVGS